MLRKGVAVRDRPTHAIGRIRHVIRVPQQHDLFGNSLPPHRRFIVEFHDGTWANDRMAADLQPLEAA